MFSVAKSFFNEKGQDVLYQILVEEEGMTLTKNVNGALDEKTHYSPMEAEEVLNLFSIATENVVHD